MGKKLFFVLGIFGFLLVGGIFLHAQTDYGTWVQLEWNDVCEAANDKDVSIQNESDLIKVLYDKYSDKGTKEVMAPEDYSFDKVLDNCLSEDNNLQSLSDDAFLEAYRNSENPFEGIKWEEFQKRVASSSDFINGLNQKENWDIRDKFVDKVSSGRLKIPGNSGWGVDGYSDEANLKSMKFRLENGGEFSVSDLDNFGYDVSVSSKGKSILEFGKAGESFSVDLSKEGSSLEFNGNEFISKDAEFDFSETDFSNMENFKINSDLNSLFKTDMGSFRIDGSFEPFTSNDVNTFKIEGGSKIYSSGKRLLAESPFGVVTYLGPEGDFKNFDFKSGVYLGANAQGSIRNIKLKGDVGNYFFNIDSGFNSLVIDYYGLDKGNFIWDDFRSGGKLLGKEGHYTKESPEKPIAKVSTNGLVVYNSRFFNDAYILGFNGFPKEIEFIERQVFSVDEADSVASIRG